eukprot:7674932-Alexandrium_andersonii.AAC.1
MTPSPHSRTCQQPELPRSRGRVRAAVAASRGPEPNPKPKGLLTFLRTLGGVWGISRSSLED